MGRHTIFAVPQHTHTHTAGKGVHFQKSPLPRLIFFFANPLPSPCSPRPLHAPRHTAPLRPPHCAPPHSLLTPSFTHSQSPCSLPIPRWQRRTTGSPFFLSLAHRRLPCSASHTLRSCLSTPHSPHSCPSGSPSHSPLPTALCTAHPFSHPSAHRHLLRSPLLTPLCPPSFAPHTPSHSPLPTVLCSAPLRTRSAHPDRRVLERAHHAVRVGVRAG